MSDYRLKAVLSDRCPFIGLAPKDVSALQMIMLVISYFKLGAYRPRGGYQKLADALTKGIINAGGQVLLGTRVNKITHDGKQCNGVICNEGNEYKCKYLISNADYIDTFSHLLGGEYEDRVQEMLTVPGVSTSFFIVYGIIREKFMGHSSIGYFPSYDLSYYFSSEAAFKKDNTIGITVASNEDIDRAPEGYNTIVLHEMMQGSISGINRVECAALSIEKAERALPELKGKIEVIDTAVPSTLHRYTGNHGGAAFVWRQVPGNFTFNGQGLKNLYIAGHWSEMGGGVLAAAYSGAKAASDIFSIEGLSIHV